jgi:hypothetical protein
MAGFGDSAANSPYIQCSLRSTRTALSKPEPPRFCLDQRSARELRQGAVPSDYLQPKNDTPFRDCDCANHQGCPPLGRRFFPSDKLGYRETTFRRAIGPPYWGSPLTGGGRISLTDAVPHAVDVLSLWPDGFGSCYFRLEQCGSLTAPTMPIPRWPPYAHQECRRPIWRGSPPPLVSLEARS